MYFPIRARLVRIILPRLQTIPLGLLRLVHPVYNLFGNVILLNVQDYFKKILGGVGIFLPSNQSNPINRE